MKRRDSRHSPLLVAIVPSGSWRFWDLFECNVCIFLSPLSDPWPKEASISSESPIAPTWARHAACARVPSGLSVGLRGELWSVAVRSSSPRMQVCHPRGAIPRRPKGVEGAGNLWYSHPCLPPVPLFHA